MKVSLNWIKDYVNLPADLDIKRLAYDLTMSTVEVEDVEYLARRFDHIVVGEIKEVLPHPNADKLRVCRVDIGAEDVKEIVCGGSNLDVGMKVVVACPGAMVRWHGEGEPVEIKNTKLRGVASFGMICASTEVGLDDLFPPQDDHAIMDISAFAAAAGTPLAVALDMDDILLEIDNKSMTNRPDLWGHYGIAREIAALYDLQLASFAPFRPGDVAAFKVDIRDEERCPRYIGTKLDGVSVRPSSFAMQSRLWRVGQRPINALVDITNYVMMATGQPTHVFDAACIKDHIEVRRAAAGEQLLLLNGKALTLTDDDLVIADAKGAVALAGVMGGEKDSVLPTTTGVILEVANFDAKGIRRTAIRYDNRSESSARFEKAIDPDRCDQALSLAMQLFREYYPDVKVTAYQDAYRRHLDKKEIDVDFDWLDRRLGMRIPQEVVTKKLGTMGFEVTYSDVGMHIVVPSWRATGDVAIKEDIMEEIARMYGYDNFEASTITTSFDAAINQLDMDLTRRVKEYLAFRCGMQEIFTYPWMSDEQVNALFPNQEGMEALSTPPAPNERLLKCSLLPNLCKAIVRNERAFESFDIFEDAIVFSGKTYTNRYPGEFVPMQQRRLGCAFVGRADNIEGIKALFLRAKGVVEAMPRYTHMAGFRFEKKDKPYWADDTVWLNVYKGEEEIGCLGLLAKRAALACGIKVVSAVLVELNMDAFEPFASRTNKFTRLPEFPMNEFDISFVLDAMTTWEAVRENVLKGKSELLREVVFVDEYKGKQIPDGKKSMTIRLILGADDRTLTKNEIDEVAGRVMKKLAKTMGADIRSE